MVQDLFVSSSTHFVGKSPILPYMLNVNVGTAELTAYSEPRMGHKRKKAL